MPGELTPEEQAHERSLEALLDQLRAASADPATPIATRELLGLHIAKLEDQIDDIEAGVFSRDTVDLQAAEQLLAPALDQLKQLKASIAKVATGIKNAGEIATAISKAISTGESLLG